jgi:hypothetical protein
VNRKKLPLLQFIFGGFLILHGLVHLLYLGQSARLFELRPGMTWPDGSWAFSKLLGDKTTRSLASVACVVATILFVAGGAGVLISQSWGQPMLVAAAVFSTVTFGVFWDGRLRWLPDQGAVAILINLAILIAVLVLQWPG